MLAAITCHFNPIEYENIVRNYWMFREDLEAQDIKLHTIELSFNGKFEVEDAMHIEGTPKHIMWQKERLLNLLIEQLPPEYDKIAWLDGDILFNNKNWFEDAEKMLDEKPLIQLFEKGTATDANLDPVASMPSIAAAGLTATSARPGYAWAARREVIEKCGGLLDTHIMGGGDNMMYYAAMGMFSTFMLTRTNIEWRRAYLKWAAKFYREIHSNLGFIPGEAVHLYHGTYADRQYVERWMILSRNRYNPEEDIRINENGIWEWASDKPDLHESVAEYFEERKEDEEWISSMRGKQGA
jgi:hypothetical protein